jgi:hypothetical protein
MRTQQQVSKRSADTSSNKQLCVLHHEDVCIYDCVIIEGSHDGVEQPTSTSVGDLEHILQRDTMSMRISGTICTYG